MSEKKKIIVNVIKWSLLAIVVLVLGVGIFATSLIVKGYKELPDIQLENYRAAIASTVYDDEENVVDYLYTEKREELFQGELPKKLELPFLAIEDKRFYSHYGIDPIRLAKAFYVNFVHMKAVQGGSSITQQLVKNAFLSNEKSIMRKVKEALITVELERKFTKEEIITKYLNEIYFSSGAYGIKTASKSFFHKEVDEMNLAEASLLAGIPNRPTKYNPRRNLDNALKRKDLILSQMLKFGFITEDEYNEGMKQKFINERDIDPDFIPDEYTTIIYKGTARSNNIPDYMDVVEKKLKELVEEGRIPSIDSLYTGGYKIYTGVNLKMQETATKIFDTYSRFEQNENLDGAMISIDVNTGDVKSIVGGKNFKTGNFNRAMRATRQPGSSFKPFVYFTAIHSGLPMNSIIEDSKVTYGRWSPRNFNWRFRGNYTLLEGMEDSVNVVAVKALATVGMPALNDVMEKLNKDIVVPQDYTASLGSATTTPFNMAKAFLPLVNGGYEVEPVFIRKIVDNYGNTIYEHQYKKVSLFDEEDSAMIVHMLENAVHNGTGRRAIVRDKNGKMIPQGGKTGTTSSNVSSWFIGNTPEYVTAIYVGRDDSKKMTHGGGGVYAAPLWHNYYQSLIDNEVYTPGKFEFIEKGIKEGRIFKKSIDTKTGLVGKGRGDQRSALFRGWDYPIESTKKYANGLGGALGKGGIQTTEKLTAEDIENIANSEKLKEENPILGDIF